MRRCVQTFNLQCMSVTSTIYKSPGLQYMCEKGSTGSSWKSFFFPRLTSSPLEMCLIDPISVRFTPRRFRADMIVAILDQHLPNPTLMKTSASVSFVRAIYFLSSTTEVQTEQVQSSLKGETMLFKEEKKGMAEKWERPGEIKVRKREKDGQHTSKECSMGLVKKIKRGKNERKTQTLSQI